jgi:hypothetical protein
MEATLRDAGWRTLIGCLVVVGCAGKNLNHVGDVNDGAGAGGDDSSTGAQPSDTGGQSSGSGGMAGETAGNEPGGKGPVVDEPGGAGGTGEPEGLVCENCELIAQTPDLRAVWAGGEQLYWIEYGSFDELGNYMDDGRLMAMPFEGGEAAVIASGLQGPIQLGATQDYAYVIVERSSSLDGEVQLTRVSLDTGDTTLLQALPKGLDGGPLPGDNFRPVLDWFWRDFAVGAGYLFWRSGDTIYRAVEGGATGPEPFLQLQQDANIELMADDGLLFVHDDNGVQSVSLTAGGTPTSVWASDTAFDYFGMTLVEEHIYAIQQGYIARMPKTGGAFTRIFQVPFWGHRLHTDGSTFVGDFGIPEAPADSALTEGSFVDESSRTLASAPQWQYLGEDHLEWRVWDATATSVYLGHEGQLYRVARNQ